MLGKWVDLVKQAFVAALTLLSLTGCGGVEPSLSSPRVGAELDVRLIEPHAPLGKIEVELSGDRVGTMLEEYPIPESNLVRIPLSSDHYRVRAYIKRPDGVVFELTQNEVTWPTRTSRISPSSRWRPKRLSRRPRPGRLCLSPPGSPNPTSC